MLVDDLYQKPASPQWQNDKSPGDWSHNNYRPTQKYRSRSLSNDRSASSEFTTQNNRILDPDGNEFIARGINISPWHYREQDITKIADCWKFNLVRVH